MHKYRIIFLFAIVFLNFANLYSQKWETCQKPSNSTGIKLVEEDESIIYQTTNGLFRTDDNTINWVRIDNGITDKVINAYCRLGNSLYAGTNSKGIFVSNDDGKNWIEKNNGITNKTITALYTDGEFVYAGSMGGGLYKTLDNGENWEEITKSFQGEEKKISCILRIDKMLFVGTYTQGVYMTENNAETWTRLIKGLDNFWITDITMHKGALFVTTINSFTASSGGVFKSEDFGKNWSLKKYDKKREQLYCIKDAGDALLIGTFNGNIYKSIDIGETWSSFSDGIPKQEFSSVSSIVKSNGYLFSAIQNKGIYKISTIYLPVDDHVPSDFNIFPNPATDFITIESRKDYSQIRIYNIYGIEVLYTESNSVIDNKLDISSFKSGIYYIKYGDKLNKFIKL